MNDSDRLLDAIRTSPDDDEPRLVYADFLMQSGDPRGELVALQCALAAADATDQLIPDENQIAARELALRTQHGETWVAPLREHLAGGFELRRGFVERAIAFRPHTVDEWTQLFARAPLLRAVKLHESVDVEHLFAVAGQRLEELVILGVSPAMQLAPLVAASPRLRRFQAEQSSPCDNALAALALPTLEHFGLELGHSYREELDNTTVVKRIANTAAARNLRSLFLGNFRELYLPLLAALRSLERLSLRDTELRFADLLALLRELPELATLDLENVVFANKPLEIGALLDAAPNVSRLRLRRMHVHDERVAEIAACPQLLQLRRLAIIDSASRAAAEQLARSRYLANLIRLELGGTDDVRPFEALRTKRLYARPLPIYTPPIASCTRNMIEAMKEYRLLSGASLVTARDSILRIADELRGHFW